MLAAAACRHPHSGPVRGTSVAPAARWPSTEWLQWVGARLTVESSTQNPGLGSSMSLIDGYERAAARPMATVGRAPGQIVCWAIHGRPVHSQRGSLPISHSHEQCEREPASPNNVAIIRTKMHPDKRDQGRQLEDEPRLALHESPTGKLALWKRAKRPKEPTSLSCAFSSRPLPVLFLLETSVGPRKADGQKARTPSRL